MSCRVSIALRGGAAAALGLAVGLVPGTGRAQAAGDSDAVPTLRPVVVTPTAGVEQAGFDVPASVDVIEGARLRDGQLGIHLSESLVRVPGVVALNRQNHAQDLQVSIRGFGARSTFGVRGLRLYVDGIPATMPDGQGQLSHFDLGSAGQLEVLRGPFSALHGASSGGVISLTTADGGPDTQASLASAAGSDATFRQHVRLAGQAGPWQYHVAGLDFRTDGSRDHAAARRQGLNAKVVHRADEGTRLTLVLNAVDMPLAQDPLGLTQAEFAADPRQVAAAARAFDTRKTVRQVQAGAVLDHRVDAVHSARVALWSGQRDTEQFQAIPVAVQAAPTHAGGVIDLGRRFAGADARWTMRDRWQGGLLTLTAGLAAERLDEDRQGFENFVGPLLGVRGALRRQEDNRVANVDPYLQAQWGGERFSLLAGVRRTHVRFDSRDRYVAAGNPDDSGRVAYRATLPAAGVVFHANERLNLYVSAGRGFETPTFNELSYRPDGAAGLNFRLRGARSRQWEAGLKAQPHPRWRFDAAVFEARTKDEIVVVRNSGGRSVFGNAPATRRRGVEASLTGSAPSGVSLVLGVSTIRARHADAFVTPAGAVAAGALLPGVPRMGGFAELAWHPPRSGFDAALEWRRQGRMAVDDANSAFAPGWSQWNLRAGLAQQVGRWRLREFVRIDNLADRLHAGSVIVNEANRRYFEAAPGRQWLLGLEAVHTF